MIALSRFRPSISTFVHLIAIPILASAYAFPAQALLIDDFTTSQSVVAPGFVTGPGILGTQRAVTSMGTGRSFTAGSGTATFAAGPSASTGGGGLIIWDGADANATIDFALPDTDLTDGGLSNRFILDIRSITGTLSLTIVTGDNILDRSLSPLITIFSPGIVEVPFAAFAPFQGGPGANFAAVNGIYFGFLVNDPGANESITFGAFRTGAPIPEPAPALLVAVGLGVIGARSRARPRSAE